MKGIIMQRNLFRAALIAAIPVLFVSQLAKADNIVSDQWYSASFGSTPGTAVSGPATTTAVDGPLLQGGFGDSINAPGASWTITVAGTGTLTATDLEESGDQFQFFDNGLSMSAAPSPFTAAGQNPGQTSPGGGVTSFPNCCDFVDEDINLALGDPNFSSATFALYSGLNVITADYIGGNGNGNMAFVAEVVPEPSSLALFATGLLGLLFAMRRKKMDGASLSKAVR
jgi:hypothetical protein